MSIGVLSEKVAATGERAEKGEASLQAYCAAPIAAAANALAAVQAGQHAPLGAAAHRQCPAANRNACEPACKAA